MLVQIPSSFGDYCNESVRSDLLRFRRTKFYFHRNFFSEFATKSVEIVWLGCFRSIDDYLLNSIPSCFRGTNIDRMPVQISPPFSDVQMFVGFSSDPLFHLMHSLDPLFSRLMLDVNAGHARLQDDRHVRLCLWNCQTYLQGNLIDCLRF